MLAVDTAIYGADVSGEPLDGATGALPCSISGVMKANTLGSRFMVANEFICARLAMFMGLPSPPGAILTLDDGRLAYTSLRYRPKGESLPPIIPAQFVSEHPKLALEVVSFDCWIANDDRHESNLAYRKGLTPPMLWDHDQALLAAQGVERLELLGNEAILNGCLVPYLDNPDGVTTFASRARWVATNALPGICAEAEQAKAIGPDEREAILTFLGNRAAGLVKLMEGLRKSGQGEMI